MITKSILITGARSFAAMDLARALSAAGLRVVCADSMSLSIARYSGAVDRFYKIAPPASQFAEFVKDLQRIIAEEHIDCLIPTCEEVLYVAKAKPKLPTRVFTESFERLEELHNKWKFHRLLSSLGLSSPETILWTGEEKPVGKWVLKPAYSRFAANVQIIDGKWPAYQALEGNSWILQKHIEGEKFCTYSVCQEGRLTAHGTYKVLHAMGIGSAICFQSIQEPDIEAFIQLFVKKIRFTGQISFDFIRNEKLYCIECNPRATSGIHLFEKNARLAESFFGKEKTLYPRNKKIFHEHLFMLWYGIKQREIFSKSFWRHFFKGNNPLWMKGDSRVLAAMPLMLLESARQTLFKGLGFHQAMSSGIEYNGESA